MIISKRNSQADIQARLREGTGAAGSRPTPGSYPLIILSHPGSIERFILPDAKDCFQFQMPN